MVNRIAPAGQALTTALELVEKTNATGPLAVRVSKRVMVESADWAAVEAFDRQESIVDPVRKSADAGEGAAAFSEQRNLLWQSR